MFISQHLNSACSKQKSHVPIIEIASETMQLWSYGAMEPFRIAANKGPVS